MERCPPEIHARIFQYACMDDGTTGCALSLVSRYIREVSYPYQWQCISLAGFKRVVQLAKEINRSSSRRPIYHLFLCDRYSPPPDCFPHPDDQTAYDLDLLPAMTAILGYASETVETLVFFSNTCFFNGAMGVRHLLSFSYPRLHELTVRACCTPRQLASTRPRDVAQSQNPRLERLHLALPFHGFHNGHGNQQATHNLVHSISPAISHLRFTMLDKWGSRRVVEVIHAELAAAGIVPQVLQLPPSDWDPSPSASVAVQVAWDPVLPEGLHFFAIQPSPTSSFYCSCCMDHRGDVDVMRILESMSHSADKDRFAYMDRRPVTIGKCHPDPMEVAGYGFAEARGDWAERIAEGHGCWKQKDIVAPDGESDEDITQVGRTRPPSLIPIPKRRTSGISRLRSAVKRLKMW